MLIVSATFEGVAITEPVLIYHEEISKRISNSTLVCNGGQWYFPNGNTVDGFDFDRQSQTDFQQVPTDNTNRLIRTSRVSELTNTSLSGLWSCRLNGDESGAILVGIYSRGGGE